MSEQGGAVVVCIFITEGECVRSVWVKWDPWRGSGWVVRAVERVRESPEGVPCSRRVSAASLKQVEAIFENMYVSFQKLLPSTRGQKRERCYSAIRPDECQSAGEVNKGGLVKFQLILN
jgi:hypothetical protein